MKRARIKIFERRITLEGQTVVRFHVMKLEWNYNGMDAYRSWHTVKVFSTLDEALEYSEMIKEDGVKWKKVVVYRW